MSGNRSDSYSHSQSHSLSRSNSLTHSQSQLQASQSQSLLDVSLPSLDGHSIFNSKDSFATPTRNNSGYEAGFGAGRNLNSGTQRVASSSGSFAAGGLRAPSSASTAPSSAPLATPPPLGGGGSGRLQTRRKESDQSFAALDSPSRDASSFLNGGAASPGAGPNMYASTSTAAGLEDRQTAAMPDEADDEKESGAKAAGKRGKAGGKSAAVTLTLRDQEKHIDSLKKENFSIKLRVHFLEERLASLAPEQIDAALKQNINLKIEVQQRGIELKKLKKLVLELQRELERAQRQTKDTQTRSGRERELEDKLRERDREIRELRMRLAGRGTGEDDAPNQSRLAHREREALLLEAEERNADLSSELENARALLEENMDEIERLRELVEANRDLTHTSSSSRSSSDLHGGRGGRKKVDLEAANEDLMDHNESLQLTIEDLQAQLADTLRTSTASRLAHPSSHSNLTSMQDELNTVRDRLAAVMIELGIKEAELEEREGELRELVGEHRRIVEGMEAEWRGECEEARGQVEELKDALSERDTESETLRLNISDLEANTADLHAKFEAALTHLEAEALAKDELLQAKEAELEDKDEELHAKDELIAEREAELDEKDREAEVRDRELEARDRELEAKDVELDEKDAELHARLVELEAKEGEIAAKEAEIAAKEEEIAAKEEEIAAKEEEIAAEVEAREGEIEEWEGERKASADAIERLSDQLYDAQDDAERFREGMERETAERERLDAMCAALKEKLATTKHQLALEKDAVASLTASLHSARSRQEELATHIESLVSSLDSSRRTHSSELIALQISLRTAQSDVAHQSQRARELASVKDALEADLNRAENESRNLGESASSARFSMGLEVDRLTRELDRVERELQIARADVSAAEKRGRAELDAIHAENRELLKRVADAEQGKLNASEKLDSLNRELVEMRGAREKWREVEERLAKEQKEGIGKEGVWRDQLTERNTLLLTVWQYLDKVVGIERTPKKGSAAETKPFTNFSVFHDNLVTRLKALSTISDQFEKRVKEVEVKYGDKFAEMRRQLDARWKQLDKFEGSVRTYGETKSQWRKKFAVKEGELEAIRATNTELTAQLTTVRKSSSSASDAMEIRSLTARTANAERRLINAQNQLAAAEEKMSAQSSRTLLADSKWDARVKEYEARLKAAEEKVKRERQGGKERVGELEVQLRNLQRQLEVAQKRSHQLTDVVESNRVVSGSSSRDTHR